MDENSFMLGVTTKRMRIFTWRKYEQGGSKQHVQDGNREWIITIGCICANGTAISPALIYIAKSGYIQIGLYTNRVIYRILGFKILILEPKDASLQLRIQDGPIMSSDTVGWWMFLIKRQNLKQAGDGAFLYSMGMDLTLQ
jgi:hypothetical protein